MSDQPAQSSATTTAPPDPTVDELLDMIVQQAADDAPMGVIRLTCRALVSRAQRDAPVPPAPAPSWLAALCHTLGIQGATIQEALSQVEQLQAQLDALRTYKAFTHRFLDGIGVPHEPPNGGHAAEGCRIGGRLAWMRDQLTKAKAIESAIGPALDAWDAFIASRVKAHLFPKRPDNTTDLRLWAGLVDALATLQLTARPELPQDLGTLTAPMLAERLAIVLQGHGPREVLEAVAQILHGQADEIRRTDSANPSAQGVVEVLLKDATSIEEAADEIADVAEGFPVMKGGG